MGDFTLQYRPHAAAIEDLALNECSIRPCGDSEGRTWWNLWFRVARETDGQVAVYEVPIAPRGSYTEAGAGGKTWGFRPSGPGSWQVSPSINVLNTGAKHPGEHPEIPSLWHMTPEVVGVPDGEHWDPRAP